MNYVGQIDAVRRVYRIKAWLRVLYIFFGLGLIGVGCFLTYRALSPNEAVSFDWRGPLLFLIGGYLIVSTLYCRMSLEGTRIDYRGLIQRDSADLSEIEGYRMGYTRYRSYTVLQLKDRVIEIPTSIEMDDYSQEWFQKIKKLGK